VPILSLEECAQLIATQAPCWDCEFDAFYEVASDKGLLIQIFYKATKGIRQRHP